MASRRKFSDEYKCEAVRMATQLGVTKSHVADDLGLNANPIHIVNGTEFDRVVVRLCGPGRIDNVRASAVPEPSAGLLFLVGAVAVHTGM
jgi:hypothetical protein